MKNKTLIWMITLFGLARMLAADPVENLEELAADQETEQTVTQIETLESEGRAVELETASGDGSGSSISVEVSAGDEEDNDGGVSIGVTVTRKLGEEETGNKFARERSVVGADQVLKEGEYASDFVTVFGNSEAYGDVQQDMVTVFGNAKLASQTGGDMVTVFGSAELDGHVNGDLVVVFGSVTLGPDASVDGDMIIVGGTIDKADSAQVGGNIIKPLPVEFLSFDKIPDFFRTTFLLFRPLSVDAPLSLWIALCFLGFYWFLTLLFPGVISRGADTLEAKPGQSLIAGMLVLILYVPFQLLLLLTIIGLFFIPVVKVIMVVAFLVGKASVLVFLGRRVAQLLKADVFANPIIAVLVGGLILSGFYLIPVVGFIMYVISSVLGVGIMWMIFVENRARQAEARKVAEAAQKRPMPSVKNVSENADTEGSSEDVEEGASAAAQGVAPKLGMSVNDADPNDRMLFARVGFWMRSLASMIDWMILIVANEVLPGFPLLPVALIYFIALWGWKGSTIGGMALGLRVQMVNGASMSWSTAVLRCFISFVSLFPMGLGFFWVAWDEDRQSWHDKITGTVVVKIPSGYTVI